MQYRLDEAQLAKLSPAEQLEARRDLKEMQERLDAFPLDGFEPHEKQEPFLESRKRVKLFAGGNRSGKTTAGMVDNLIQSLDREDIPEHLVGYKQFEPPFYCRILSPDLIDTLQGVLLPKLHEYVPVSALLGGSFKSAFSIQNRTLKFKNGSRWQFMSFEMETLKMGGAAFHRIWYDEEPPQSVRNENQTRLWDYGGQEVFTMTPLLGMTWMYDGIYRLAEEVDYITVVEVDSLENPHINHDAMMRDLESKTTSKEEALARRKGKFVSFAGLIYDNWDRSEHILPEPAEDDRLIPENATIYMGIDPGLQFMCAVLWVYLTIDNTMVVFDEMPFTDGETIPEICRAIQVRNASHGQLPHWNVIDPASRNRNPQTGRSDQMAFADNGVIALPGQNAVPAGINEIKRRLEEGKLFITANCTETIKQMERYRWKAPTRQREQEEDDRRSRPVKKDDHLLDALRYVAMSRPLPPKREDAPDNRTMYERMISDDLERSDTRSKVITTDQGAVFL